jgi:hypothetical protein
LSPKAYLVIACFMVARWGSVAGGYQPVTYAPSSGLPLPPLLSTVDCWTLPRTEAIRALGGISLPVSGSVVVIRRKESKKVGVLSPSTAVTQRLPELSPMACWAVDV